MRLSPDTKETIQQIIHGFDPHATILLFGSRANDTAKGGDIDLLIISDSLTNRELRKIRIELQDQLGVQKFDLVLSGADLSNPFARLAFETGVPL
jgi:predicted nucleotidyltransferase